MTKMAGKALPGLGVNELNLNDTSREPRFLCTKDQQVSAFLLTSLGILGVAANIVLILVICFKGSFKSWTNGLLFHQAVVDLSRSAILIPLGQSIYACQPVTKCSLVETTFLLLVTVSTVNLLSVVLNDAPILPEADEDVTSLLKDSPQCMTFGLFMIWFASVTVNLGPTFLSGALAANAGAVMDEPSCPLVQGPYRHYVLNAIWILINLLAIMLTIFHLRKLYKDFTKTNIEALRVHRLFSLAVKSEKQDCEDLLSITPPQSVKIQRYIEHLETEGITRVKMYMVITTAYLIFWAPLFLVTLTNYTSDWKQAKNSMAHEVSLHICFIHAFVNPLLFLVLNKDLRQRAVQMLCCVINSGYSDNYDETGAGGEEAVAEAEAAGHGKDSSLKSRAGGAATNSKQETLIL